LCTQAHLVLAGLPLPPQYLVDISAGRRILRETSRRMRRLLRAVVLIVIVIVHVRLGIV
jgi:hypothetical protein